MLLKLIQITTSSTATYKWSWYVECYPYFIALRKVCIECYPYFVVLAKQWGGYSVLDPISH